MAKTITPTPAATDASAADAELAALRVRQAHTHHPLEPGSGTPWEDRGSIGPVSAFVRTVGQSLARPGTLLQSMRRPETAGDARIFAIACGIFWGLAWVVHGLVAYRAAHPKAGFSDFGVFDAETFVFRFAVSVAATWGLLNLVARLAYKLISAGEMKVKFPPVLLYNVYAYALGPSVLAPIPYVGPLLALLWIFALFVYGCRTRLMINTGGAITCNLFAVGGVLGLAFVAYYSLSHVYGWLYSSSESAPDVHPPPPHR
jgi:hypothetical protein